MIYHFYPIDRPMIWGAEQWILSAYPGRDSICVETGQNIWRMLCEQKEQLVGKHVFARYGDTFPLLIKFIDARDDLSVQERQMLFTCMARSASSVRKTTR